MKAKLLKRKYLSFSTLALASVLSVSAGQALADPETAVDFSVSNAFISITTSSQSSPTILGAVTATCPEAGLLVATGTIGFQPLTPFTGFDTVNVEYGISKNSFAMDASNSYEINLFTGLSSTSNLRNVNVPVSKVRLDGCSKGESVTYRLAARKIFAAGATASEPRLVVMFFKDRM